MTRRASTGRRPPDAAMAAGADRRPRPWLPAAAPVARAGREHGARRRAGHAAGQRRERVEGLPDGARQRLHGAPSRGHDRAGLQGFGQLLRARSSTWPTCPTRPTSSSATRATRIDGTLVGAGLVANLDPYYEQYGWNDWYGEGIRDQFQFTEDGTTFGEGPLWGIAESADFVGVFYNVEKLAALGLEPPTTFAEFEAALAAAPRRGELPIKLGNLLGLAGVHVLGIAQGAFVPAASMRDWVFGVEGGDFASPANLQAVADVQELGRQGLDRRSGRQRP